MKGLDELSSLRDEDVNKHDRVAWSGELLHSNETSEEATKWQTIYQRGVQMRRNLATGKCEMWRFFLTDEREKDHLSVRKMTRDTVHTQSMVPGGKRKGKRKGKNGMDWKILE